MSGKRRRFTEEFKREAVTLATSLGSVAQAAEDLAVSPNSLYQWMKKCGSGKRPAGASEVLEAMDGSTNCGKREHDAQPTERPPDATHENGKHPPRIRYASTNHTSLHEPFYLLMVLGV